MLTRMVLTLVVTAAVIGLLAIVKARQIQVAIGEAAAFQPPPEAVTTIIAKKERWPTTLKVIGTTAAVQGVTVAADLPGIVERIAFESGAAVREGELLVQLDTRQEQAQLAAVEADRDLAKLNFERLRDLINEGAISRADFDTASAEQKRTEARVGEIRAAIARKTIRAPFSGILGIRQVNLGQYLSNGDAVAPLQSLDPIFVNFGVPQQDIRLVSIGRTVRVSTENAADPVFTGRITAMNSVVDETTRNIQVQATLSNPRRTFRPGMFVETEIVTGVSSMVVPLPASSISYAPYGDSVFVVTDLKDPKGQTYVGARQQFVKLGPGRGDQIAVVQGVEPGDEVVTSGVFKLRNGSAVLVNNKVQPDNKPDPNPEDN